MPATEAEIDQILEIVAKKHLRIPTLEPRNMDSLDFHNVSVWELKAALRHAYGCGRADA